MRTLLLSLSEFIIRELFTGYGFYTIAFVIYSSFRIPKNSWLEHDHFANKLAAFSGLVFLVIFSVYLLMILVFPETEQERQRLVDRLSGSYAYGVWLQQLVWVFFSQLLWFRKIQHSKILRILIAVFLITSFEAFVIIITSFHRDYVPASDLFSLGLIFELILGVVIKTLVFLVFSVTYYRVSRFINQ